MSGASTKPTSIKLTSLEAALFYVHPSAGEWSMLELSQHQGVISSEDLEPDDFFNVLGVLRLYHGRFSCFLQTGAAGELNAYVYFLLTSAVGLSDPKLAARFPWMEISAPFFGHENVIAGVYQEDQTRIVLQDAGGDVAISYLDPEGKAPEHRLSPYFQNVRVEKRLWRKAALAALDEYFAVADERMQASRGRGARLGQLVASWKACRAAFEG